MLEGAAQTTRTASPARSVHAALPRVYIFQPRIQHYRLPVWDELVKRGAGQYEITAIGPLESGAAFGGGEREYLRPMREFTLPLPALGLVRWPDAIDIVRNEKPEVVIVAANPRNVTCWRLPKAARAIGASIVGHMKVHSFSGAPPVILTPLRKRFYNHFDFAICYGQESKRELLSLGFPAHRARVAQNTIDTRRIFEQAHAIAARGRELRLATGLIDKKILLCIGRMEPDKRHVDLLKAWPQLAQLDSNLVLVLVSGGPLLHSIKDQAQQIDPQRIHVTGRVPEGDDYAWIATSDITIYPGAVGLAINQSLALGRPTIIADEYGSDAEIVAHEVTGWRYRRGDLQALIQTVGRVLNDSLACRNVAENARVLMRDQVTIDNMAGAMHATIMEAIELSRQRRKAIMHQDV